MNPDDIDTVIYHVNCNDGKALAAYLKLEKLIRDGNVEINKNAEYIKNCSAPAIKKRVRIGTSEGMDGGGGIATKGIFYNTICVRLESDKLVSEIAENIYNKNDVDFVICWFSDKNNKVPRILEYFADYSLIKWIFGPQKFFLSLRTDKENIDLGQIARIIGSSAGNNGGGGGHRKSAGLCFPAHPSRFI
jgi:hypothetical protein